MIAAVYARKSSDDERSAEDGRSIDRQVALGRAFAESKGWAVGECFTDDSYSGADFTRPGPRRFDLAMLEHRVGRAVLLVIGGAHFRFPLVTERGSEPEVNGNAAKHQPSGDR